METRDEMIRWNEGKLKKWDRPLSILYQGGQNTGCRLPFDDESFDVVILWAQTFGLLYGDDYKSSFLKECRRTLKKGGLISFSGHDREYLTNHYLQCLKEGKFYPYSKGNIYWESFTPQALISYAENGGFCVILCEQGEIYKPEDGIVLHCLGKKQCNC